MLVVQDMHSTCALTQALQRWPNEQSVWATMMYHTCSMKQNEDLVLRAHTLHQSRVHQFNDMPHCTRSEEVKCTMQKQQHTWGVEDSPLTALIAIKDIPFIGSAFILAGEVHCSRVIRTSTLLTKVEMMLTTCAGYGLLRVGSLVRQLVVVGKCLLLSSWFLKLTC